MKYIKYFATICIAIFIVSCAKDKGNYTYSELNDVTIEKINNGKPITKAPGEVLKIEGKFSRKLDSSIEGLSYIWTIGEDTVSINKDLEYTVPEGSSYGSLNCRYIVIDDKNGMHYSREFNMNIRCPYGFGYYVLCKEPNNSSKIYFLPSNNDDTGSGNEEMVISTSKIGDYELGSVPTMITGGFSYVKSVDDYVWTLYVGTGGNENNIIVTTSATMLPDRIFNSNSFYDGQSRNMSSSKIYVDQGNRVYFLSEGKVMSTIEQYIYRPARHNQEYSWTNPTPSYNGAITAVLDQLSNKYAILTPNQNNVAAGTTADKYALDKVTVVKDCPDFKNRSVIDVFMSEEDAFVNFFFTIASVTSEGISIDKITYDSKKFTAKSTKEALIAIPGSSDNIKGVAMGPMGSQVIDWYFAIDNVLYSSPNILHKLTKLADLPKDLGKVRDIKTSSELDHVILTMYNSLTGKGSLVRVWIQNGKVDVFENVMSEPISLFSADGNPLW